MSFHQIDNLATDLESGGFTGFWKIRHTDEGLSDYTGRALNVPYSQATTELTSLLHFVNYVPTD